MHQEDRRGTQGEEHLDARAPEHLEPREADALFERLSEPGVRELLIELYTPLAEYFARRFWGRGEPVEDLFQVATIGLINAIDRFDPSRGVRFSSYAAPTIVGELKRHFRDRGWDLRVPRRLQEMGRRVSETIQELQQTLGRSPTIPEIARRAGLTEEQVLEGMEAAQAYSLMSLDASPDEQGSAPVDVLGVEDSMLGLVEGWVSVVPFVLRLPERERLILQMRFFEGLTQGQIAERMGISQMHVSRLLSRTLRALRRAIEGDERR